MPHLKVRAPEPKLPLVLGQTRRSWSSSCVRLCASRGLGESSWSPYFGSCFARASSFACSSLTRHRYVVIIHRQAPVHDAFPAILSEHFFEALFRSTVQ